MFTTSLLITSENRAKCYFPLVGESNFDSWLYCESLKYSRKCRNFVTLFCPQQKIYIYHVVLHFVVCWYYVWSLWYIAEKMPNNSDGEESLRDPYRDDPAWQDWHADAVDVQGGPDDSSSEEEDDESGAPNPIVFPETCVCLQCRSSNTFCRCETIFHSSE